MTKFSKFDLVQAIMRPPLNNSPWPLAPKSVFEIISLYMLILEFGPINANNNMDKFMKRVVMLDSVYLLEQILHLCDYHNILYLAAFYEKYNIFMYMLESKYINWGRESIRYLLQMDFISDEYIINKNIVKDMLEKISSKEWILILTYHKRYNLLKYIIITYPSYVLSNDKNSSIKVLEHIISNVNNPRTCEFLKFYLNYDLIVNIKFCKNDALVPKIDDSNLETLNISCNNIRSTRGCNDPKLNTPILITPNDDLKKLFIVYQKLIDINDKKLNKILFTSKFYLRFCIFFDYRSNRIYFF